jgi:hypothetical protein
MRRSIKFGAGGYLLSNMLESCPTTEDDFLNVAGTRFGVSVNTVRPFYLDALSSGAFEKTSGPPPIIKFKYDAEVESWEKEHGLPERSMPTGNGFDDVDMFEAAISHE